MKKLALLLKRINMIFSLGIGFLIMRQMDGIYNLIVNNYVETEIFLGIKISENISYRWYIIISVLSCFLLIYLMVAHNLFSKVVKGLSEKHIFTKENGKQLAKVGRRLFVFGIGLVIFHIALNLSSTIENFFIKEKAIDYSIGYTIGYAIAYSFKFLISTGLPIFMISLFMFIISHLINEGHFLKQENELTI